MSEFLHTQPFALTPIVNATFADAANRLAGTNFTPATIPLAVDKVVRQLDTNERYIIVSVGPLVYRLIGGGGWSVVTETTPLRGAASGEFILVNAATCSITLPAPAAAARVAVKVITSTVTSVELFTSGVGIEIDGTDYSASGLVLTTQYEQLSVISDGSNWWIY